MAPTIRKWDFPGQAQTAEQWGLTGILPIDSRAKPGWVLARPTAKMLCYETA